MLDEELFNEIDEFSSNESDDIYNVMCDLQSQYYYFLDKMNSGDLLLFIIDLKFNSKNNITNHYSHKQLYKFINNNCNEIYTTLSIINSYLFKKYKITQDDWIEFCYKYTT
jgi:hypothetical protein